MRMFAVFKREYFQVVRKKSFLILTVLMPFLLAGLMIVPAALAMKGLSGKRVAVVDATGALSHAIEEERHREASPAARGPAGFAMGERGRSAGPLELTIEYVPAPRDSETILRETLARLNEASRRNPQRVDGVLAIPSDALSNPAARMTYYTRTSADFMTQERLARLVNHALVRIRLTGRGLAANEIDGLLRSAPLESVAISSTGAKKKGGELNFLAAFVFILLLLLPMLIYGQEIMRGIVAEKTDRVVEILVSSMSAMELLAGKVLGLAAAGLTQVGVWLSMGAVAAGFAGAASAGAGFRPLDLINPRLMVFFLVFYVLGYLVYACIYAVGGAISNSDKEAQQVAAPLILVIMIPWILAMPMLQSPQSALAITLSLVPIFTPITMFLRIVVSEPPAWQIALSILLSVITIYILFWITAKIFRVGILSYGKRPTIPELVKWLKLA